MQIKNFFRAAIVALTAVVMGVGAPALTAEAAGSRRFMGESVIEAETPADDTDEEAPQNIQTPDETPAAIPAEKIFTPAPAPASSEQAVVETIENDHADTNINKAFRGHFPWWAILFLLLLFLLPRYTVTKKIVDEDGKEETKKKRFIRFSAVVDYIDDELTENKALESIKANAVLFNAIGRKVDDDKDATLVYMNVNGIPSSVYATDDEAKEMEGVLGYYNEDGVWTFPADADADAA